MKLHLRRTACNDPAMNSHPATQQRPPKCAAPHRERRHSHARAQQQHTLTAMRAFHRRNNGHHVDLPGDGEVHCRSNEELREHDMCFTAVSVSNPPTTAPTRPPSKPFVAPDAPAPAKLPPLPASDRLRPCNPMHAKAPMHPLPLYRNGAPTAPLARLSPLPALLRVSYLPPLPPLPPSARLHRANKHTLYCTPTLYCIPALCPSRPLPLSIAIPARVRMRLLNRAKQAEEANAAKVRRPNQAAQIPAAPLHRAASRRCGHPRKLLQVHGSGTTHSPPSVYPVCSSPLTRRADPRMPTASAAIAHQQSHYITQRVTLASQSLALTLYDPRAPFPLHTHTPTHPHTHTPTVPPDRAEERARQLGAQGGAQPQAREPTTPERT